MGLEKAYELHRGRLKLFSYLLALEIGHESKMDGDDGDRLTVHFSIQRRFRHREMIPIDENFDFCLNSRLSLFISS